MNYEKIWQKVLNQDEKAEFEFSIGNRYMKLGLIIWCVIGFIFLLIPESRGFGVMIILVAYFYYSFYLRAANAYAFTNKRVLIHRGWLSTHTISVDYSKITDIHIVEPFFSRMITHTGNLAIVTAGSTKDQIILDRIEKPYEVKKKLDSLREGKI